MSLCKALLGLATRSISAVSKDVTKAALGLAGETCAEGVQLNGHDYHARFYHASFLAEDGRIKKAAKEYKAAASINPTEANAHFMQGRMLQMLAGRAKAKALKAKSGGDGSEMTLARKAVKALKRAVAVQPQSADLMQHYQLGLAALTAAGS